MAKVANRLMDDDAYMDALLQREAIEYMNMIIARYFHGDSLAQGCRVADQGFLIGSGFRFAVGSHPDQVNLNQLDI